MIFSIVFLLLLIWFFLIQIIWFQKFYINFNYIYLLKFIIFNICIIIYYFFYLIIYIVFFIFKNFRFFKYYNTNINTAFFYFNKKSIYFLFWRYLVHYLFYVFIISIKYMIHKIKIYLKEFLYINNIYLFFIIYIKTINYINFYYINYFYRYFYNIYIYFIYHIFYFINIDEIFNFINIFKINIIKYIKDPLLNRNINFHWFSFLIFNFYKEVNKKSIFFYKFIPFIISKGLLYKYILGHVMYFIHSLNLFFDGEKNRGLRGLLSKIYLSDKMYKLNFLQKLYSLLKLFIYGINLISINIIYYIILFFTYFVYTFFNCLIKIKQIIIFLILFLILIKYYWIIYYFLFLLYKHYLLYIPLVEVKESTRFFNFEWIDFRNYFNLIFLHNTLVDLSVFNNIIYNDLLNNLNKSLSVYGFKIEDQYDIGLYTLWNMYNKDTILLNNLLDVYNKSHSYSLFKWYESLKKLITNKAIKLFKFNRTNYKHSRFYQKPLEQSLKHNSVKKDISYLGLNREHFFKNNYKKNFVLWKMFNKSYIKKVTRTTFNINVAVMKKVKKIPLKYIYLYNNDYYYSSKKNFIKYTSTFKSYFIFFKRTKKYVLFFWNLLKKFNASSSYSFYFGRVYNFDDYKHKFQMKYKIPTFEWTATRWRRKIPNHLYFNVMNVLQLEENQKWYSFYDLAKKKMKKKRIYKAFYLKYKYPFSLNQSKNIIESLSYLKQLDNYIKIIKKNYYVKNSKIYFMRRYYKKLLHSNNLLLKLYIYKLNNWKQPFLKKQLHQNNNIDLNFWSFFDYFKVDKYYYIKYKDIYQQEETDFNLYFIKKARKDYIKLKNNLLRLYSLYFQYYYLERSYIKNYLPLPFKKKIGHLKNRRLIWNYESFKLNWILKLYLTKDRANYKKFQNVLILSKLFKQHFFSYFIYCDYTINAYNELYYIKIKSYKLRILNKINNLKRFFYYKNKYIVGFSFFKYFNSLSLQYHIKHFLWNSPYAFLLFHEDLIYTNTKSNFINKNKYSEIHILYVFSKLIENEKENKIINLQNYSMIFNFFSNITELKYNWYELDVLQNTYINNYNYLYLITFLHYYNNVKNSNYKSFYMIDLYRFIMNFLFEYYTNFLYRLTRYRYILDYKNYTFYDFIKNYFNYNTKKNIYFKLRLFVNELKFIKRLYKYVLVSKNLYTHNAYKKQCIPFWFIFDYYIKLFVYFLLTKYYIKNFFIYYWILKFKDNFILNSNVVFITIIYYNIKLWLNKYLFNININYNFININTNNFIIKYIYNYFILFIWYFSIIFQFNFDYIYNIDSIKIKNIFKWLLLICNQKDIYKYNFNKIIFIKFYLEKILYYYLNIFFNFKNNLIFFKSNYIFFRKQRSLRELHINKLHNSIFKNTVTYRNINSFKHLTNNILFFKNIYLSNTYNYVYLLNISNINIINFKNFFIFIFKYNYMYLNIIIYLLLYWFIFLFFFIFYRKFYNIFYFTYFANSNYIYNINKLINNKVILLSKKKQKLNKLLLSNKIKKNIIFNFTILQKLGLISKIKYNIFFLKNKESNEFYWNNNNIIEIPKNTKLLVWPAVIFNKYLHNLFFKITKMPFTLKKENKNYNFYFHDFLNNNLFNFCFFYWFLLIPYFFFEFILIKYHLKGHILIKRKFFFILKVLLDNFTWFIKLYKVIGDGVNLVYKHRYPKTYKAVYTMRNRKKLKFGYFFKWDRFDKQRLHMSALGSHYLWFFKINKIEYLLSYRKYFFNTCITSNYFNFINLFFIILVFFIKKYTNKIYKKINVLFS